MRRFGCIVAVFVAVLAWLTLRLPAQQPAAQETPTIRATARLVEVSVVVRDKQGKLVTGLTKEDFLLLEEGKPQNIGVFTAPETPAESAAPPLPANTFSNRRPASTGSATVLLLDGVNTMVEDQIYARQQVRAFLEQVQPHDRVAIYVLTRKVHVLHDFSSDVKSLLRALDKNKLTPAGIEVPAGEERQAGGPRVAAMVEEIFRSMERETLDMQANERARLTARALEAIALHLAQMPGRKNLVWVAGMFPFTLRPENAVSLTQRAGETNAAVRALNQANVAVYPVDARGLVGWVMVPLSADPRQLTDPAMQRYWEILRAPVTGQVEMGLLARDTGGRAFANTNDITGAVKAALDDARAAYTLGFYPSHGKWDSKYRKLKVQVKREGLDLHHRPGYYAFPEPSRKDKDREYDLLRAGTSPLPATVLALTVEVLPESTAMNASLRLRLDARQFHLEAREGRYLGAADVMFLQRGGKASAERHTVSLNLTPATYAKLQHQLLDVIENVELAANTEELVVVVRDQATGASGSVVVSISAFRQTVAKE
jgi:VWFA-related protein